MLGHRRRNIYKPLTEIWWKKIEQTAAQNTTQKKKQRKTKIQYIFNIKTRCEKLNKKQTTKLSKKNSLNSEKS